MKGQQDNITLHARTALRGPEKEAVKFGADDVIGIRYSNVFGNNNLVTGATNRFVQEQAAT